MSHPTAHTPCFSHRNHAPQQIGQHITFEELGRVRHGNQLDGVGVQCRLVVDTLAQQMVVHGQMRRQLRCGFHGRVGYYLVCVAGVGYADERPVLHRSARQIAHAFVGALAEEIAALEVGQRASQRYASAYGGHAAYPVVDMLRDIHGDIAAVALGPAFLPKISCHLRDLLDLAGQCGTSVKY